MKRYALIAAIIILLVFATTLGFVECSSIMSPLTALEKSDKKQDEWVILLHGIMRSPRSMNSIEHNLENRGYRVTNFGYPSTEESIETIAALLNKELTSIPDEGKSVNFVTHSMGSIVVRYFLANYQVKNLGRVVMIAPPNRGSIIVSYLKNWPPYRWFFGEAGQELARAPDSLPNILPVPPCEFGIIAGGVGNSFGFNPLIPGDDDGTVGVDETRLPDASDFIQIKGQHSTLLMQMSVIDNVIAFLEEGKFIHPEKNP
ncbi:MAG: alpha/beta hydrolase [Thermodesulfobacteriota bacterium]|nr:alpha/beta hydrolase [Thermodesulfobacteriota bacterium]